MTDIPKESRVALEELKSKVILCRSWTRITPYLVGAAPSGLRFSRGFHRIISQLATTNAPAVAGCLAKGISLRTRIAVVDAMA